MSKLSTAVVDAIRRLVDDLVAGNFASIEADGRIGRLTQEELRRAIAEYGRTLAPLPGDGLEEIDVYPSDQDPRQLAVDVPLWTREEGRSDLTLSLTVVESDDVPRVSIDDLHVL